MLSGWHLLGTNQVGRDVLVRTLYALHTSEQSALLATLIASVVGIVLGSIAGYRGGWLDTLIMRLCDMFGVLPAIMLLLIGYTYFYTVTVEQASLIIAFYLWIPVARVVRAQMSSLREREFVLAALSLGASDRRIFFRHLLPNGMSTIIVATTTLLGQVIVLEATLEFFGIGVPSCSPADGREPDRRRADRQPHQRPRLVDAGHAGRAARPDPRLRQSPRRRAGRSAPPRESALAVDCKVALRSGNVSVDEG